MYPRVGRNRRKTTDWDEILDICFVYFPIVTNDVFLNIVTRNHLNMNVHVKGIRIKGEVRCRSFLGNLMYTEDSVQLYLCLFNS